MKQFNKFFYLTSKGSIDPDSQWKQQNEQHKKNKVYAMVNFAGGGTLIEAYSKGNTEEESKELVQNYFKENVAPECLCETLEVVTEDDYQKWHSRQSHFAKELMEEKQIHTHKVFNKSGLDKIGDEFSVISLDSVVLPYSMHHVKWKLEHRGAIGETPLHLLFLLGSKKHIKIAEALLEKYPELAMDVYEGFEYYGESCLHFAIIQNNLEAVDILLKTNKVDLHAQARGKFFIPVDIKRGDIKLRKHKFEGYAYYGEYPLSFAASTGNKKIYDKLIASGCDPNRVDRYGNGVLHLAVIHNQPDMYYHALTHQKKQPNPDLCNNANLTPLALAAKLGKTAMFKKILDVSSRHYWSYNTVTCSSYPLKSLDTIGPNGETDWNSALMMIVRGKKINHLDMVSDHVVHQLLNEKWNKFGQKKFFRLFFVFVLHILFLSTAIYLRPNVASDLRYGVNSSDIARYVFEIFVIIICCFVVFYAVREIYLESLSGYWQNIAAIPSRLFYLVAVFLLLLCVPIRFLELYNVEVWLLVFAVPGLWSYMLFFLRNFSLTGPFITMIFRIFGTDMIRFVVIYMIMLLTCAVAFFYQFEGQNVFAFLSELGTIMTLFQMSFGEFDYTTILQGKYEALTIVMFVVFMIMVHILLLNMLIAMITRTYEKITNQAEKIWRRQWASMVIVMERSHRNHEKVAFQKSYDLNIDSNRVTSDGDAEHNEAWRQDITTDRRALMVVYNQEKSETKRKIEIKKKLINAYHQTSVEKAAHQSPQFKIHSMTGLSDLIRDAPRLEEHEVSLHKKNSSLPLTHSNDKLNYSDEED